MYPTLGGVPGLPRQIDEDPAFQEMNQFGF